MNRRVSSKSVWKNGCKERNRRTHVVSTPCHQPWSQPRPHTLHFTLLTTSPAFLLLWPSLFLCRSFWLDDKRRMVCVMSNKHTKVALLFLCQPSFSNCLFLLVTSPHSCPCGVVMSVHAQSVQPMRPSEVSAIITSLWCLVFVVWCPQPPLLFLIHPLHHPLVVLCDDCMVAWCYVV